LKTEQESKRLREAQGRRVRRSQSINTRTQSVRRTSIRDKVLTTKKDAQEEARLRLQAQQTYVSAPTPSIPYPSISDFNPVIESLDSLRLSALGNASRTKLLTSLPIFKHHISLLYYRNLIHRSPFLPFFLRIGCITTSSQSTLRHVPRKKQSLSPRDIQRIFRKVCKFQEKCIVPADSSQL